jgi:hypothetical protein
MKLFLENVDCHLVFFTDTDTEKFILECRKEKLDKTRVIILPIDEWVSTKNYPDDLWKSNLEKDSEKDKHSVELYKVWYEKKEFVRRAIELNPFNHTDYVWADAGIIVDNETALRVKNFPNANRIPTDRMLLLNVKPFTSDDSIKYIRNNCSITGNFKDRDRIGGGILAANKTIWLEWCKIYDTVFEKYRKADRFLGKDQSILATAVLENKSKISLVTPRTPNWHYLLFYLK